VRPTLLALVAALSAATLFAQSPADSSAEGKAVAFTQRLLSGSAIAISPR